MHEILIDHNGPIGGDRLQSLFPRLVRRAAPERPARPRQLRLPRRRRGRLAPEQRKSFARLEHVAIARPHFLALGLDMLPSERADQYRADGMPVVAWTVRSPAEWDRVERPLRQPDLRGLRRVTALQGGGQRPPPHRGDRPGRLGRLRRRARLQPPTPSSPTTSWTSPRSPAALSPRTGWAPQHLAVRDEAGAVAAVDAALSEVPQPGRIRLRPQPGPTPTSAPAGATIPS